MWLVNGLSPCARRGLRRFLCPALVMILKVWRSTESRGRSLSRTSGVTRVVISCRLISSCVSHAVDVHNLLCVDCYYRLRDDSASVWMKDNFRLEPQAALRAAGGSVYRESQYLLYCVKTWLILWGRLDRVEGARDTARNAFAIPVVTFLPNEFSESRC